MTRRTPFTILETSPVILWAVLLICLITIIDVIFKVPYLGARGIVVDFDAFYVAGEMTWQGRLAEAYHMPTFFARLKELAGQDIFMIWSYPPQYDLVTALFPLAPRGVSYALFMLVTLSAFVLILRRMAGPYLAGVLMLALPSVVITLRIGQNGLLTGMLVGLFALGWMSKRRGGGGIPLGLMAIKPHLALGLGLLVLVSARWRLLAIAVAVVIATSALSTLVFGPEVWTAFLASTKDTAHNLKEGYYPLFRMTSAYAMVYTFGVPPQFALLVQVGVALVAAVSIALAYRSGWSPAQVMGLTIFATVAVSPYNYDYDTPILILGLALLAADIATKATPWEKLAVLVLTWTCSGWGVLTTEILGLEGQEANEKMVSLGAVGHLALWVLMWRLLRRGAVTERAAAREQVGVA